VEEVVTIYAIATPDRRRRVTSEAL
jgi:hypothetical protein